MFMERERERELERQRQTYTYREGGFVSEIFYRKSLAVPVDTECSEFTKMALLI